jgi:Tfp pilus assembly protein PilF
VALNGLGYFLTERNEKLEEALEMTQRAVNAEPNNSSYLDSLGWVYFKMGKLEEAERYLKRAIEGSHKSPVMYDHLGDVYEKQGKKELAVDSWQKALSMTSDVNEANKLKAKLKGETQKQK